MKTLFRGISRPDKVGTRHTPIYTRCANKTELLKALSEALQQDAIYDIIINKLEPKCGYANAENQIVDTALKDAG